MHPTHAPEVRTVALHEAARRRYLAYALSVITARALPDVRDGLKPVQRRILYAMEHQLHLRPDGRYRKSAAVVGAVMARFHPHGDQSIYDAMVRMAQPFSLLHPLVDGQGNFGSLDGDPPAAMRYTEARLAPMAIELLEELKKGTVPFRPNYDGQAVEPVVLPARLPQLLVNGSDGIAVGMATRIPPHNLREVIDACILLIDHPDATLSRLCRRIRGPDFPTGARILSTPAEIEAVYREGQGSILVRGDYDTEKKGRRHYAVIRSLPWGLNKASLVERIGQLIRERRLPQLTDVRDESTDQVRIVCELRRQADAPAAMAFLFKHTPLQQRYHLNLTCLVPTSNPELGAPARLDLRQVLRHWLDFRFDTVRRRFEYDLERLLERIHLLEAYERIFDHLDEAIRIIRASEGRRDAADRLMDRFELDDVQADAILDTRLYKLAKLEILAIREELEQKRKEAARMEGILASDAELWAVVRRELVELRKRHGAPRRTQLASTGPQEPAYREDAYIVSEDALVIVTRDGWVKRQGSFTSVDRIRIREDDEIGWIFRADTRSTITFFTGGGSAFTLRVDSLAVTTGYGEPVQRHFEFAPGERIVGVLSHDPRNLQPPDLASAEDGPAPPYAAALTRRGRGFRFPVQVYSRPSKRGGRRFARLRGDGDAVVAVWPVEGQRFASIATRASNLLSLPLSELKLVHPPAMGITAIKVDPSDHVLAFELAAGPRDGAVVVTSRGREERVRASRFQAVRGARGSRIIRKGRLVEWRRQPMLRLGEPEE